MLIGWLIPIIISLVILSMSAVSDLGFDRIPNLWILIGLTAGVVCRIFSWSFFGWGSFFLGMLIPFVICWIPFRMGAMGAGDVKLLMVIGILNGGQNVFYCIFFSFLIAAGISLVKLLRPRQIKKSLTELFFYFQTIFTQGRIETYQGRYVKGHTIHFAVAILLGYALWEGVSICRIIRLF